MKKCIFCGLTESDFNQKNCWTVEHIIPEALGNKSLKINNVCKNCNSGLGANVDSYFVNHFFLKMIRQTLEIKGKSGEIPNAFKEGNDEEGRVIRVDGSFRTTYAPYVEKKGNKIKFSASSKEEIKKMIKKKLYRMNISENEIQIILKKVDQAKSHYTQPEVIYDASVNLSRFYLEALKIAFEYAIFKLGEGYLMDSRAIEIQQYLNCAINGGMKTECKEISGVCLIHTQIVETFKNAGKKCHMLVLHADAENRLIVEVILFMTPFLSFSVLVSNDASKLNFLGKSLIEIVDISK